MLRDNQPKTPIVLIVGSLVLLLFVLPYMLLSSSSSSATIVNHKNAEEMSETMYQEGTLSNAPTDEHDSRFNDGEKSISAKSYLEFRFEVFGKVQGMLTQTGRPVPVVPLGKNSRVLLTTRDFYSTGVSFRKHTQLQARRLGLVGFVYNTIPKGTVKGLAQGSPEACEKLKYWLKNYGSPKSRVDSASFYEERYISKPGYNSFRVAEDGTEK